MPFPFLLKLREAGILTRAEPVPMKKARWRASGLSVCHWDKERLSGLLRVVEELFVFGRAVQSGGR